MSLFIETVISSLSLSIRLSARSWLEPFALVHVNSLKCWKLEIPNENLTIGANQSMLYYNINTTWICRSMGLQKEATQKKKKKSPWSFASFYKVANTWNLFFISFCKSTMWCVFHFHHHAVNIFFNSRWWFLKERLRPLVNILCQIKLCTRNSFLAAVTLSV